MPAWALRSAVAAVNQDLVAGWVPTMVDFPLGLGPAARHRHFDLNAT